MLSTLALVLLSQAQPAVRRSTPLVDDPGMVVRNIPSGTQNVNVVGGGPLVPGSPDGGLIGTVIAIGPDGGAVPVQGSISATNPSVGPTASTVPAQATLVGGPDSSNLLRAPFVLTTTPDAGDPGLVVRVVGGISGGGGGGGTVTQGPGQDGGAWAVDTEMPAPAALSDSVANPTTPLVGSALMGWEPGASTWNRVRTSPVNADGEVAHTQGALDTMSHNYFFNGTAWDRFRGTIAGGLLVDVSDLFVLDSTFTARLNTLGQKTMVGSAPVVIASDQSAVPISGTVTTSPPANATTNVTQFGGNAVVTGTGTSGLGIPRVTVSSDSTVGISGTVTVTGTVNAAQSGTWTVRNQDGVGNNLASSTAAPAGTEQALIVRNIPSGTQTVTGTVTASGTVTANQGTPGTTANRWPVQLTDGTDLSQVSAAGALLVDGSATTQPISGTVTANAGTGTFTVGQATPANLRAQTASESAVNAAAPTSASYVGFRDPSGNLQPGHATDVDTSGAAIWAQGVSIVGASFGAPLAAGTAANVPDRTAAGLITREVLKAAATVASKNVSCATTATSLTSGPLANRHSVAFYNNGTSTVFIGPSGVTTANGFPVPPGATFSDDIATTGQEYFCIVAAGTEPVRVLEN